MPFVNRNLMTPGITDFDLFLREVTIFLRSSFISTSNNVDAVYQLKSLSAYPVNKMNIRQCSHNKVVFCMEFQEGMALCSHGSKFASKSWKFVWNGRVITRRQFPSEKKTPSAAFCSHGTNHLLDRMNFH